MPEIICDWMLCKYNTSQKVGQLGRCIKEDGVVKLESKVVTGIEGMEVLRLLCNAYFEDEKKSTKIDEEYRRNQEVLQYYIVNTDLNMSVGKIAVSVGHINTLTTIDIPSNWREREDLVYSEWVDNGMKKIVNYLISKGRTKIALIREPGTLSSIIDREKGFIEAMQESYLGFDPECIFKSRQTYIENGKLCASKVVTSKVKYDAIVCMVDTTAIGVIQELNRRGINVPDDIAVTGFGDEPSAVMVMPHLTTAKIDVKKMGSTAAELLLKQLDKLESGQNIEPIDIKIPVEIVIRDSA